MFSLNDKTNSSTNHETMQNDNHCTCCLFASLPQFSFIRVTSIDIFSQFFFSFPFKFKYCLIQAILNKFKIGTVYRRKYIELGG